MNAQLTKVNKQRRNMFQCFDEAMYKFQVKLLKNIGENQRKDRSWSFLDLSFLEISLSQLEVEKFLSLQFSIFFLEITFHCVLYSSEDRRDKTFFSI